jgi:hypothetical protein
MELEQKIYVKTKKKETLEEVLNLLSKYSYGEEEYNIDDYKDFTFAEDIYINFDFFKHIYETIKDDGIMIYMDTDSSYDPHTSLTYYFGDGVKGEEYDTDDVFYSSLYDDSCIKYFLRNNNIQLTKSEEERMNMLGIKYN